MGTVATSPYQSSIADHKTLRRLIESWQVLVTDDQTAAAQMAMDEQLAKYARPIVRLFRWAKPALSLGFRQRAPEWVDPTWLLTNHVELVERPTGGGLAVHGSDLSLSVVAPHQTGLTLKELMGLVCESVAQGLRACGASVHSTEETGQRRRVEYCLIEASPYALLVGQRKLGGLAARRYPTSWLVQGSVLVRAFPEAFRRVMPGEILEAFEERAIDLEEACGRATADEDLMAALIRAWRMTWGIPCFWSNLSESNWRASDDAVRYV